MVTTRQLAARLDDVEGALLDERHQREQQLAEIDEELEDHRARLARMFAECRKMVRRIAHIDQRVKGMVRK